MTIDRRYKNLKAADFDAPVKVWSNGSIVFSIATNGAIVVSAPSSGQYALQVQGVANQYALNVLGATSPSGQSFGVRLVAGTTSGDLTLNLGTVAGLNPILIWGDGHGSIGADVSKALSWTAAGAFTIGNLKVGTPANPAGLFDVGGASPVIRIQDSGANGSISELFATNTAVGANANWQVSPVPYSIRINFVEAVNISTALQVAFPQNTSAAGGTAAVLDQTTTPVGVLRRTTSSLRYKSNVETLTAADIDLLLQMRPVSYTSTCDADDPTVRHVGFIAEEIAAIDPRYVVYIPSQRQMQSDGLAYPVPNTLVPESVRYERLVATLVGAVQMLTQRVAALEAATAPVVAPALATPAQLTVTGGYGITGTNVYTGPLAPLTVLPPTSN